MKSFSNIVAEFITTENRKEYLASKFEVAISTVCRWATGIARPYPTIKKLIIDAINNWKE